ncbi:MAG: hypothetical protein ABSB73_13995, partial [Solirubrobacteraceae bacterium]
MSAATTPDGGAASPVLAGGHPSASPSATTPTAGATTPTAGATTPTASATTTTASATTTTSRERVELALAHREADRVPLDLGGGLVTGMHVSSVYKL